MKKQIVALTFALPTLAQALSITGSSPYKFFDSDLNEWSTRVYFQVSSNDLSGPTETEIRLSSLSGSQQRTCEVNQSLVSDCYFDLQDNDTWEVTNLDQFTDHSNTSGSLLVAQTAVASTAANSPPVVLPSGISTTLNKSIVSELKTLSGDWVRFRAGGGPGGLGQSLEGISLGFQPLETVPLGLSLGFDRHLDEDRTRVDAVLGDSFRLGKWRATGSVNLGVGDQKSGGDTAWLSAGGELWFSPNQAGPFASVAVHNQQTDAGVVQGWSLDDWRSTTIEVQAGWRQSMTLGSPVGTLAGSVEWGVAQYQSNYSGFARRGDDLAGLNQSVTESAPLLRLNLGQTHRDRSWLVGLDYVYEEPRLALHWTW